MNTLFTPCMRMTCHDNMKEFGLVCSCVTFCLDIIASCCALELGSGLSGEICDTSFLFGYKCNLLFIYLGPAFIPLGFEESIECLGVMSKTMLTNMTHIASSAVITSTNPRLHRAYTSSITAMSETKEQVIILTGASRGR